MRFVERTRSLGSTDVADAEELLAVEVRKAINGDA